ncbi:hypothetical protein COCC4DRAFT_163157 [Bipolaris maydis ATCC 48331]|uniref:Uncharacterized protein n=2 Tax=Cochliobolus heterostrophus TaxID=5016 RepID=M2U791_COCH5|nr:uncharacterized protein COCC4DRAFT_163157 [Bipolaris maydis ATCC 48331]EMD94359.1 hypothetical protein COCHEDRAFT_1192459 [Bipolaris maydis C5]KAJ5026481.1 hypothetical protein J3E73DRAFT_306373 [Bipolaris maydis]ENI07347.1 hypothetical protein COCC4DRAFT_163157 [Bipolaris maydis ATCC 48331]KAJ5059794.1 hypothetical protein J3E74DRAFT_350698 [Bipolaris maydis]KAJ6271238.1 hypothetical protein PSV08DRAFT_292208 [Bipolaris maydis]
MGGLLFPVVCAAPLPKEVMDRFIEDNGVDADNWRLVFVDSIDDYYDKASEAPMEHGSNPNSPFIGKTPQECHQLLLKLREDTGSKIMTDVFAIMDERSTQDDTVLLVCAERDLDGEHQVLAMPTVRATFQASGSALILYETGHSSVDEDAERAASEEDNVYRGQWSTIT